MSKFMIHEILNFDVRTGENELRIAQIRNLRMPAHMPGCMRGDLGDVEIPARSSRAPQGVLHVLIYNNFGHFFDLNIC